MAAPANTAATTAVDITSLPYTINQTVDDAGTTYTVWYKYTAVSGDEMLGIFGLGSSDLTTYLPKTSTFLGPAAFPVAYLLSNVINVPVQIPVVAGTTYYFRFSPNGGNPSPAVLHLNVQSHTPAAFGTGDLLVNDDFDGFPLAVLSGTTGAPLRYIGPFPAGEAGDNLATGICLFNDAYNPECKLYNSALTELATVALDVDAIRAQRVQYLFYAGIVGSPVTVKTINAAGVIGSTTWHLTGNTTMFALAANNAGTILYFSNNTDGSALKRWDLDSDTALSNLVGVTSAPTSYIRDILVMGDDTILASYVQTGFNTVHVRHYQPDGTLIAALGPYDSQDPGGTQARLSYDGVSQTSIWVWTHGIAPDNGLSKFLRIDITTGDVLDTLTTTEYEIGVYQPDMTLAPTARFGNSFSCPFLVIPGETPVPSFTTDVLIPRRQRRAPHLSREQLWNFYSQFQLDLETGIGLTSGYGSDPQIMLRWSDDGGHTWSKEHWVTAGARGSYKTRAIWRRLGRSRDRVFEVTVSDPVAWNLLAAYLQVDPGTS